MVLKRALLLVCLVSWVVAANGRDWSEAERFYGEFEGQTVSETDGEITKRDLRVNIHGHDKGFTVGWISVTPKPDGRVKRKEFSVDFYPTSRDHVYRSGERKDMFGNPVPLDPLKGHPYVWARIDGPTLTIYALHVLDDGGYELQQFARTRVSNGLDLKYSRIRDGKVLRTVSGMLKEVQ
jgi:hypothetical protein